MRGFIFDIDGTLTDTKEVDDYCFINSFQEIFDIDISGQDWSTLTHVTDWGITEELVQAHLGRAPHAEEYTSMENRIEDKLIRESEKNADQFSSVPGAIDFFERLKDHPLGIATGAWQKSAAVKLSSAQFRTDDIPMSTSSDYKSRENIVTHTINKLKRDHPQVTEVIYFGDGVWDYKCCANLGIRFIGIDILNDGKLKQLGASEVYNTFLELDIRTIL